MTTTRKMRECAIRNPIANKRFAEIMNCSESERYEQSNTFDRVCAIYSNCHDRRAVKELFYELTGRDLNDVVNMIGD